MVSFFRIATIILVVGFARASAETVKLDSPRISLTIDAATGSLQAIENKVTGDTKTLRDIPFQLTTTRGEVAPFDCKVRGLSADDSSAAFRFSGSGLDVDITYQIVEGSGAVRKLLVVTNRAKDPVTIQRVTMFQWTLPGEWPKGYPHSYNPAGVNDIHFHRSGIWNNHPINLFLRDDAGGLFAGIENPYFEAKFSSLRKVYPARVEVSYQASWILARGESFDGDPAFVGAYRQEGVYAVPPSRTYFSGRERKPLEILDWGEVWAMQDYMRSIMPLPRASEKGYYMTYWGRADPGMLGKISRAQQRGEKITAEQQAMLAHFGGGPFAFADEELWYRLTPETVAFYKRVIDDAETLGHFQTVIVPNMMAGNIGWFESPEQKADVPVKKLTDTWFQQPAYKFWKEVADYAASKNMGMFTLELAGREYRERRADWRYQDADGKLSNANCYANRAYADWYTAQVDAALTRHPIKHWQWDEGWLDVLRGLIGEEAHCYANSHGHPPGNVSYQIYRNVARTLETLKQRHPDVRLVIISGLIRAMPWIMKNLDADSHTGAMEDSGWVDNNTYFLPPSRSHRRDGIHWILDNFSAGEEPADTGGWYSMLANSQAFAAYKKRWDQWIGWASEHQPFLERRRDLFHQASAEGLQGTAHALGPRGFIFVHNASDTARTAQLDLNARLGLEESPKLKVALMHPEERELGIYAWEAAIALNVPPKSTLMLSLEPTGGAVNRLLPSAVGEEAFLTLDDVRRMLTNEDLWPASPLPGTDKMPKF